MFVCKFHILVCGQPGGVRVVLDNLVVPSPVPNSKCDLSLEWSVHMVGCVCTHASVCVCGGDRGEREGKGEKEK